jgi:hypothetical protein
VKQLFTARDMPSKRFVSELSGQVGYYSPAWKQLPADVFRGHVSPAYAAGPAGREPLVEIRQELGPHLTDKDIADISRHPNRSIVTIERNSGCSAFIGAFPVHTDWPITKTDYEQRWLDMLWPAGTDATIELAPFWPAASDDTIVPTHHPALAGPGDSLDATERLRKMKRRLDME